MDTSNGGFAVTFRDGRGKLHVKYPLLSAFEENFTAYRPVRKPPGYRGMGHMPGLYWHSRMKTHVSYESRLELAILLQLDFEPSVLHVLPQPFVLHFEHGGRSRRHTPDFLVWHMDGRMTVIDVKSRREVEDPAVKAVFNATQRACEDRGITYSVQSEPPPSLLANLVWLAGYKVAPASLDRYVSPFIEACSDGPQVLKRLIEVVGPNHEVRPVLFHLLWRRILVTDFQQPLRDRSLIDLPKGQTV